MKIFKIIAFSLLLVLLGFSSCRNESIDVSIPQTAVSDKKLAFDPKPQKSDDVYIKLRDFKEKLRLFESNTTLRGTQTMPVEQVVWNVEAYLNAAYGFADKPFKGQIIKRDSFIVSTTNREVSGGDVVTTLASAKSLIIEQYRDVTETVKHIVFIDITSKAVNGNQIKILVSSFIGLNPIQSRVDPYTSTDNWKWAGKQGKCNGTQIGQDALTRLNEELNTRYVVPSTVRNPVHMFFTDIDSARLSARDWETPNDTDDNIRDYLLFNSDDYLPDNFSDCIPYQDMNWYYNNIYYLISNTSPSGIRLSGKSFLFSNLGANSIIHGFKDVIFHDGYISFGIPHFCWVAEPCDPMTNCYLECD